MDLEGAVNEVVAARGTQSDSARLHALFDAHWRYTMEESPEFATYAGWPGQGHRWTDLSLSAIERRNRELELPLRALDAIDRALLPAADRLHYDLFRRNAAEALEGGRFKAELVPLTQMQGPQQDVARMLMIAAAGATRAADFEDMLARLEAVPEMLGQVQELMRAGAAASLTPPRITLRDVPAQIASQAPDDVEHSPLRAAFARLPETLGEGERA